MRLSPLNISKYETAFSKTGSQVSLWEEIDRIKTGLYKEVIEDCRQYVKRGDKLGYSKIKSGLPAVTFGGVFDGAHKKDNLLTYSGIMIIDIDNVDDAPEKKAVLFADPYVFAGWLSPSGIGIKLLIATDATPETHKFYFDYVASYLNENYAVNVDKSGSDVCRLCYVSYDKDLLLKPEVKELTLTPSVTDARIPKSQEPTIKKIEIAELLKSEKALLFQTEGRNDRGDRLQMEKIIRYLKSKKASITESYSAWLKVAFAIANTFTYDVGQRYFLELCRLDGEAHHEEKSQSLLEHAYRNRRLNKVTLGSIIYLAGEKGFRSSVQRPKIQ